MGRFSGFLRLCAILFVSFFVVDAFGAGYTCPSYKQYTSCNAGYYLSGTGVGNSCVICPVGSYCPGGTYTAPHDCDSGSTTANSSNIWTTGGAGKTARNQCYRNVVISRKYNGGNSSATGTLNVLNPVTGGTIAWSSGDLTIQVYYNTAFTLPASSGLTFDSKWYEVGGWASTMANSTYGSSSSSTAVTFTNISTATSYTLYPVIKAKPGISLDCQGCDTQGTASLYYIYGNGMYLDSAYAKKMVSSANPITIPVKTGDDFGGYYKSPGCSGTQIINANGYYANDPRVYADTTLYACWSAKSYPCSAGTYLPRGATTCATCVAGYRCPGGTYGHNPNANSGMYECTGYKYSAAGASACSNTSSGYYATGGTTCTNNGTRCTGQTICDGGYYCTGGQKEECPDPKSAVRTAAFPAAYNANNSTGVTISLSNVILGSSSLSQRTGQSAVTGCQALFFWKPNGAPAGLYEYVTYNEETGKYEETSASDSAWAYYYVTPGYQLTTPANNGVCYGGQRYYKAVQKCPINYYCNHTGNMSCTDGETYTDALPSTRCVYLPNTAGFYYGTDGVGASKPEQCFGLAVPGFTVLTPYAEPEDCPVGSYCPGGEYPEGGYGADEKIYYGQVSATATECPAGFTSDITASTLSSCYCTTVLDKNGLSGTIFGATGTNNATRKLNYGVTITLPRASTLSAENATFTGYWSPDKPMPHSAYSLAKVPNQMTSIKVGDEGCPARLYAVKKGVDMTVDFNIGVSGCELPTMECYANSGECILPEISCSKAGYVFAGWMNTGDDCDGGYLGNVFQPGDDVSIVGGGCESPYAIEFTAQWIENGVTCAPGYYAKKGETTCNNKCGYGYYCPGGGGTTAGGDFGRHSCSDWFTFETTTDKSHLNIGSASNTSSQKTQCYVESYSGYRLIFLGYTDDGVAGLTTDLSPANYSFYSDRFYYGAQKVVLSSAMTCADDLGSDRFVYSEPGSQGACYAQIVLDKNGGSGTINGVSGTDSAVQRVYYDMGDNKFPATTSLSSSIYNFTNQWGTDTGCERATYTPGTDYYFYDGDSVPEKLYACRTAKKFSCEAGTYLPMGKTTCDICLAGSYCPGVQNVTYNESKDGGIYSCPEHFTSDPGATSDNTMGLEDENVCYINLSPGYAVSVDQANGSVTVDACDSEIIMRDAILYGMDVGAYYCPGGDKIKYQGPGLTGVEECPDSFVDAQSAISSRGQCAFKLQPGDSIDGCDFTFVNTVGSCAGGDMSYFCPGYTVTIDEVAKENDPITWCVTNKYLGYYTCPVNSTTSADQTHCTCNYGYQVSDGAATITNATQKCVPVSVTVPAGSYLPAGSLTPAECGAGGSYCPGATCSFSATMDCGREACPDPADENYAPRENVDWVDSAKLPDERKNTSVVSVVTLNTWSKNLQSINQCRVTYTIQNDAGTMLLEGIYYDSDSEQYTDDRALIPYYAQLNPGYYLHTPYTATYCTTGNANGMYYQFAEKCPQNSYCPGLKSMPKCGAADSVRTQFGYTSFTYGDDLGAATCAWGTNGKYVYSDVGAESKDLCYLNTSGGYAVYEQGAGQVMCQAGQFCIGGTTVYYGKQSGSDMTGGFEYCSPKYPESAPGNSEWGLCYVTLKPGEYVAAQGTGAAPCPADDYCPGDEKIYTFVSDGGSDEQPEHGGNYPCPDPYLDNTALGKELVRQCLMDVPGGYYVAESGATQYVATDPGYYQPTSHSVGYGETSVDVLGYEYIACSGQDKYQDLTAQTSCNTVSWGYYTTKNGAECTDGVACTGQAGCDGGYYCTAQTGIRKACPDARTHRRTTQFTSTNSNLIMPTVTLDMLEELTNTSVTSRTLVGDITGCQVLSWYTAKPVDQGGKASLYEYAMYVGDEENGEYSNTTAWGYMSVQPGYYLSSPVACGAYAYYHVLNECESGQYCPGKDKVACDSSNQATVHTSTFGMEICPTNYGASPARATAQNQCYLTTTAGTYVAEPNAAPVTCPGGYYCPATDIYWGATGGNNACPAANDDTRMTTFPASWYPVWQDGHAPDNANMINVRDFKQQLWTKGLGSIGLCRAQYFITNAAGDTNIESVRFNENTGDYDIGGDQYYATLNPGFYFKTRYSDWYCKNGGTYMYYRTAVQCPEGSYCPGYASNSLIPKCSSGEYLEEMGINSCSSLIVQEETGYYPYSPVGSSQATQCYLTTKPGEAVYSTEYPEACPGGAYCPGGVNVNYGSNGGFYSCAALTENGFYSGSYRGADDESECYGVLEEGYYIDTPYSEEQKQCAAGTYWEASIVYYGKTTTCPACTNAPENAVYTTVGWNGGLDCPWECNDGYNQTVDANGNPMCGQMCTVPGMNYIKSSTGLSIPLYSSKGAGWARAIGVSLDGGQTACYGRLEQDTGNAPSGSLRVNVGGTKYYAVE